MTDPALPAPPALDLRPESFARERRSIFAAAWLLLGRRTALRGAGDYLCANLAGWPVFAIETEAGEVIACRNVCRHQGLPLLDNGTGTCRSLRCRYHGWTYDLSGRFVEAPAKTAPPEPGDPIHHLPRVAVATLDELLFVHLGNAPPPDMTASTWCRGLRFHAEGATDIAANWKLVMALRLARGDVQWRWPTLVVETLPEGVILHQVVPRSFDRTRVIRHAFAAEGALDHGVALTAAGQQGGETLKAACEAAQAAHQAGTSHDLPETPILAEFLARFRAPEPPAKGN